MYNFDDLLPNGKQTVPKTPLIINSYPPVTPPGSQGPFFVNTYFLQPDRKSEIKGAVPVRSSGKCS